MNNRVVRLNESDLEKLVQKILKEEDGVNTGKNPFKSTGDETITLDFIKEHIIEAIDSYGEEYDESMEEGVDALSRMMMGDIKDRIYYVSENYEGEIEAIVMDDWRDWFMTHKYLREEDDISTSGLKKDVRQTSSDLSGLSGMKKDYVNKLNQLMKKISGKDPIPAGAKPLLDKLFKGFNIQ